MVIFIINYMANSIIQRKVWRYDRIIRQYNDPKDKDNQTIQWPKKG
jgi:hypothetical protein